MVNYAIVITATVALVGSTFATDANAMPSNLNARAADQTVAEDLAAGDGAMAGAGETAVVAAAEVAAYAVDLDFPVSGN
ncbi:hypothetical protein H4S08_002321 [Coemansia sp. RSA 1365]|nr:hypothetical protein H4S08_002321 [Coemansia sp. RSA 1365]